MRSPASFLLTVAVTAVLASSSASAEPRWVQAKPASGCGEICLKESLFPVGSTNYQRNQAVSRHYICAAKVGTQGEYRPGYNTAQAQFPATCGVGYNGREEAVSDYICLCDNKALTYPDQ